MKYIYQPSGRAREYSPYALNIYNGCDHGCKYCYIPMVTKKQASNTVAKARKINLDKLAKEASQVDEQVLLSFIGDPYCIKEEDLGLTRKILQIFRDGGTPTAILTKGGNRLLRDMDILQDMKNYLKVGATLTFHKLHHEKEWEPNASPWGERRNMLQACKTNGIRTFASIEPVISPVQSLELIEWTLSFVDEYLIGKLNHDPKRESTINWNSFAKEAMLILDRADKDYYIKKDLRDAVKVGVSAPHDDPNFLVVKRYEGEEEGEETEEDVDEA